MQKKCVFFAKTYKKSVGDFMANTAKQILKTTKYLNPCTGELNEKESWVDTYFNDDGYLFYNRKMGYKIFTEICLPEEFTWSEKGRIQELQHYILKDNQLLVYRSNDKIKPIGGNEMCRIFDMSGRQCRTLINKMKSLKVIKEVSIDGIEYFAFNPLYAFKDKRLSVGVYLMFQEELRSVLPQWVIKKFAEQIQELRPSIKII